MVQHFCLLKINIKSIELLDSNLRWVSSTHHNYSGCIGTQNTSSNDAPVHDIISFTIPYIPKWVRSRCQTRENDKGSFEMSFQVLLTTQIGCKPQRFKFWLSFWRQNCKLDWGKNFSNSKSFYPIILVRRRALLASRGQTSERSSVWPIGGPYSQQLNQLYKVVLWCVFISKFHSFLNNQNKNN